MKAINPSPLVLLRLLVLAVDPYRPEAGLATFALTATRAMYQLVARSVIAIATTTALTAKSAMVQANA